MRLFIHPLVPTGIERKVTLKLLKTVRHEAHKKLIAKEYLEDDTRLSRGP